MPLSLNITRGSSNPAACINLLACQHAQISKFRLEALESLLAFIPMNAQLLKTKF